jgi:hypothetical protein
MPNTINADSGAISSVPGVKVTADTSGVLALQADGTTIATLTTSGGNQMVVSGVVTLPAGSAAAPSIAPTGDSNTGIFFPAADTIAFSEGGVEAIRLTSTGNLQFSATGQRITGDFSNATESNRLAFQSSTTNGGTRVNILTNGTGTASSLDVFGVSDPTNAAVMRVRQSGTESQLLASITGTGTYLPMTFYTGGSERVRINTSGNLLVGTSDVIGTSAANLQVLRSASSSITIATSTIPVITASFAGIDGWGYDGATYFAAGTVNFRAAEGWSTTNHGSDIQFRTTASGSGGALFEVMRLTSTGALAFNGSTNYGSSGQVLTSNGNAPPTWQLPAGLPTMNIVSGTTQTAVANNHYVLTNASATTVTLPAGPAAGAVVWITVANGRVDNVVARNGQNINSLAENMTIDSAYAGVQLRYADATRGWVFT